MQKCVELLRCAKPFAFLVPLNPQSKPHTNPIIITIFHWGLDSSYSQSVTWTQATPEPVLLPMIGTPLLPFSEQLKVVFRVASWWSSVTQVTF